MSTDPAAIDPRDLHDPHDPHGAAASQPGRRAVLRGMVGIGFGAVGASLAGACSVDTATAPGQRQGELAEASTGTRVPATPQPTSAPLVAQPTAPGLVQHLAGLVQTENAGRVYALSDGELIRYQRLTAGSPSEFVWEESGSTETGWDYEQIVSLGFGVLIGRTPTGELHWHRDLSIGLNEMIWSPSSGLQIAEGWQLDHLVALHSGHLLAIDPGGETWWHQWLGDRWHPASGSVMVADDWDFDLACGAGGGVYSIGGGLLEHHTVLVQPFLAPAAQPVIETQTTVIGKAPGNGVVSMFSTGQGDAYFEFGAEGPGRSWMRWSGISSGGDANVDAESTVPFVTSAVVASDASALLREMPEQRGQSTVPIDGYWQWQSVDAGANANIALSALAEPQVSLVHLATGATVIEPNTFLVENQGLRPNAWREGCNWPMSHMGLPADLDSDLYAARIEVDGDALWLPVVVRPPDGPTASLAVLANTNTWNAYNAGSGISQYTNPFGTQLSFQRPNRSLDPAGVLDENLDAPNHHLVAGEVEMLAWLHREGISYDSFSDLDLHDGRLDLDSYQALLIHSHPEYWTIEMFDNVAAWLDRGGVLINLGGNCVYERVTYSEDRTAMVLRSGDPEGIRDLLRFSGRPERPLLGAAFEGVPNDNDPPGLQKGSAAGTFAPYRVIDSGHRFFADTGLSDGDLFVTNDEVVGGAGWELDTSYFDGHPASAGPAPDGLQLLARGILGERAGEEGRWTSEYNSHMTYYDHPGGGWVFSGGSLVFTHWMVSDPRASQLIRNVFDEALS